MIMERTTTEPTSIMTDAAMAKAAATNTRATLRENRIMFMENIAIMITAKITPHATTPSTIIMVLRTATIIRTITAMLTRTIMVMTIPMDRGSCRCKP